jgi:hypothetical protein
MTRDELIKAMAEAMHDHEYTDAFDSLWEPTRLNLIGRAKAALAAIEAAGYAVVPVDTLARIQDETIAAFHSDDPNLGLRSISLGDAFAGKITSDEAVRLIRASNAAVAAGLRASPLKQGEGE